jgi:hypothetical protein
MLTCFTRYCNVSTITTTIANIFFKKMSVPTSSKIGWVIGVPKVKRSAMLKCITLQHAVIKVNSIPLSCKNR